MTYNEICNSLRGRYGGGEARAVARYLLEVGFGLRMTDILCGAAERLPAEELRQKVSRLAGGEPVQYVVGAAEFCGRLFHVGPGILIPRPETEELCRLVKDDAARNGGGNHILDIGTGSGCIAVTLALDMPGAQVEAWDVSSEALAVAAGNAAQLCACVKFRQVDILTQQPHKSQGTQDITSMAYDRIVSNPPYIVPSETAAMEGNVLDHEPHLALFAPEDDPLLFYCAIAGYAMQALRPLGKLFLEINPLFAGRLGDMLAQQGFTVITFSDDRFGRTRFAVATKPQTR